MQEILTRVQRRLIPIYITLCQIIYLFVHIQAVHRQHLHLLGPKDRHILYPTAHPHRSPHAPHILYLHSLVEVYGFCRTCRAYFGSVGSGGSCTLKKEFATDMFSFSKFHTHHHMTRCYNGKNRPQICRGYFQSV